MPRDAKTVPTYRLRRTHDTIYLDAGPCPHCAADGRITTTTHAPDVPWLVKCDVCGGEWPAYIDSDEVSDAH